MGTAKSQRPRQDLSNTSRKFSTKRRRILMMMLGIGGILGAASLGARLWSDKGTDQIVAPVAYSQTVVDLRSTSSLSLSDNNVALESNSPSTATNVEASPSQKSSQPSSEPLAVVFASGQQSALADVAPSLPPPSISNSLLPNTSPKSKPANSLQLANQIRGVPAIERTEAKIEALRNQIVEEFDKRLDEQRAELEAILAEAKVTDTILTEREEKRTEIVESRLRELLGEVGPLDWDYQPNYPVHPKQPRNILGNARLH